MYVRGIITLFTKAKAAKLIKELVDLFLDMESSTGQEVMNRYVCISGRP